VLEGLQSLVVLSRVDIDLAARERELAEIPAKRSAHAETQQQGEARREAAREAVGEAESAQRHSESDMRDKEALLAKLEGQQHQVKSNEAYTALLHEMEQARQAISDAETRILEAMEVIEQAGTDFANLEREVTATAARLEKEGRALDEREQKLSAEIEQLKARRQDLAQRLDRKLLDRYERIAARHSPAIVIVSAETCQGCRVGIPPQSYIEILEGAEIVTCEQCHRILIHEDQLRQPAAP
jgi:hypothetical protein